MIHFGGTPVWHASISVIGRAIPEWTSDHHQHARILGELLLSGRGDQNHSDVETGVIAIHFRRKISDAEKRIIGPAQVRPGVPSE